MLFARASPPLRPSSTAALFLPLSVTVFFLLACCDLHHSDGVPDDIGWALVALWGFVACLPISITRPCTGVTLMSDWKVIGKYEGGGSIDGSANDVGHERPVVHLRA